VKNPRLSLQIGQFLFVVNPGVQEDTCAKFADPSKKEGRKDTQGRIFVLVKTSFDSRFLGI
jgi:hypothetical protein